MRRHIQPLVMLALALATAPLPGAAVAAPGDLDPSFGSGGRVLTDFGSATSDRAHALALQPDGKIVAAGFSSAADGTNSFFALARYNADGSLDPSFGSGGKVLTDFGTAFAVALQPDGKIVAAGVAVSGGTTADFALVRYDADGSLDPSFGSGGRVLTDFGSATHDQAHALALQPDGKIVAAGFSSAADGTNSFFALARYNADGSLDLGFGAGGKVQTAFGFFAGFAFANALALQPDGKIVAAGLAVNRFTLARYNADGSLDLGFGAGGKVQTAFGGSADAASALALQPDGKIVAAGSSLGLPHVFALARYNADGSLDQGFGSTGKVLTAFGVLAEASALALQPDGKIVVAGRASVLAPSDFALARYNVNGELDLGFGSNGKVLTDLGSRSSDSASALALQPDGKIVVAGAATAGRPPDFALVRYLAATEVSIDIKPGSSTDPIRLSGGGLIPVAILTTDSIRPPFDSFDATTVDPSSVCFGAADNAGQRNCTEAHGKGHIEDVNGDGRPDLLLHYELSQTGIDPGDTTACLTGKTFAGTNIEGCDSITTVP